MLKYIDFCQKKKIQKFILVDKYWICGYFNLYLNLFAYMDLDNTFNTVAKVTKVKISNSSIKCSFRISKWMGKWMKFVSQTWN